MAIPGETLNGAKARGTPSPGLEVDADDVVFDVTAWRKAFTSGAGVKVRITDETGNEALVNDDGQLHIVAEGKICDSNSTTTPLSAGAVFTGTAQNILAYNAFALFVTSDVASADGGLEIQYSRNGVDDWRTAESYTVNAGAEKWFTPPAFGAYYRVRYTNGGSDQTSFELTTVLRKVPIKWSSHNIEEAITDEDDATLTKAVITGKKANGDFDNASLTNGGNFKVSLEELETQVSDDSNTRLMVSPYSVDEYGTAARLLSDNIFQGALITIPVEHHEIHCGDSYESTYVTDLGNGATLDILIIVPDEAGTGQDQKLYHLLGSIATESECDIYFYEGATYSAQGTSITQFNRNRNSALTDYLGVTYGPTITGVGTMLEQRKSGVGRSINGVAVRQNEWLLRNDETYLLRINNTTTTNCYVEVGLNYYVHPGV